MFRIFFLKSVKIQIYSPCNYIQIIILVIASLDVEFLSELFTEQKIT